MMEYFHDRSRRTYIPKGTSREGFMHTNLDFGVKYLSVVLFHPGHTRQFAFVVDVPANETDYQRVDFDALVPPRNQQAVDREGLQRALEVLPCCTLGPDTESPVIRLISSSSGRRRKRSLLLSGAAGMSQSRCRAARCGADRLLAHRLQLPHLPSVAAIL